MMSVRTLGEPDASINAAVAGVGPNMNGVVPCRSASAAHTSSVAGSSAACAPRPMASSRRVALRSTATTRSCPWSTRLATAASPTGPQPNTATPSPSRTSACSTACMPTASGSANAATSSGSPSGTGCSRPASASRTSSSGVRPPNGPPPPMRPSSSLPGSTTTRSPTRTLATWSPTHDTTPAISWPRHSGSGPGPAMPPIRMYDRSLPQIPHAAIFTTASRGPGSGGGTSSTRTSPGPWTRTWSIGCLRVGRGREGQGSR